MSEFKRIKDLIPLEEYANSRLEVAHGKFVCPFCGSGGHDYTESDSAFHIYGNSQQFHCFGCGAHGDLFDLVAQVDGIPTANKIEQINAAKRWLGEESRFEAGREKPHSRRTQENPDGTAEGKRRASRYVNESQAHIAECAEYLSKRGFPLNFAVDRGLGFDPVRRTLVMPYPGHPYYFISRSIDPQAGARYFKPKGSDVGPEPIFNGKALDKRYAIAVEGQIDCLSVLQVGFNALSVGGAANWRKVIRAAADREPKPFILILFDRDPAGIKASRSFFGSLKEAGIRSAILEPPQSLRGKDPNEWLVHDRERFRSYLASAIEEAGIENGH